MPSVCVSVVLHSTLCSALSIERVFSNAACLQLLVYHAYLPALSLGSLYRIAGSWPVFRPNFMEVAGMLFSQVCTHVGMEVRGPWAGTEVHELG